MITRIIENTTSMKILILSLVIAFFSCKNNAKVSNSSPDENSRESTLDSMKTSVKNEADSANYRLVIMFYSIGEGIENEYITAFEDSISGFSSRIGKNINFEKMSWGREGETDYCFQLRELTDSEKMDFIDQTRLLFKKAKWVNIYENYPCMRRNRNR